VLFFVVSCFFGKSFKFIIFPFIYLDEVIEFTYVLNIAELNASLLNGLLTIHPYILFSAYAMFFFFLIFFLPTLNKLYYSDSLNGFFFNFFYYTILIAIFLGGSWAQQELN
jgi:hypothetical protein